MKHGIGRKLLSVVLAVMMLVSLLPTAAFAEDSIDNDDEPSLNEVVGSAGSEKGSEENVIPTATNLVTVNGTDYATLAEAIANATPVNGVITYEINGKADISGNDQWISFVKDATDVKKVVFIGKSPDAEISITSSQSVLGVQDMDIDVELKDLTLSHPNGAWVNDLGHATNYFSCIVRNAGHTVTYTNCTFPDGACNSQYGKTVFDNCHFTNNTSGKYNLWNYGGDTEIKNSSFTGTRGVKTYNEGTLPAAPTVKIENTSFKGLTEKAAIVASKATDITLADVSAIGCDKGLFQKAIEGSSDAEEVVIAPSGSNVSGTFEVNGEKGVSDADKKLFNITAGTFTSNVDEGYLADGFTIAKDDNGNFGVTEDTDSNVGTQANPYTLAQLGAMTRAEYITAQEKLGGTMYVTVGDYSYDTNGVLGNGTADNSDKDSTKMNYYGAPGAKSGQYSDAAVGKSIVFVGGSITSSITGYKDIDNIGTSLLLAVPAYTNVTFKDITFTNVMSFNYQLYTSPWSQLGELKFDNCTFNGIIVGAIAAQTLTFNGCEFKNYTNTIYPNSSNPTWIRPAYGNWTQGDNEGQGSDFKSLTTINFTGNTVTSTRPVKFERIAQWEMATTVTATGNSFDIKNDGSNKNVGMYFGANAKFDLVLDETNTKSKDTAALYTAVYSAPDGQNHAGLPAGSTVKDTSGNEFVTDDALEWKTDTKLTLKSVPAETPVAMIGTTSYASLAAAIAAANNGDTVTLLKDVTENVEIAKEKNLTLDLNGKTLSGGTGTAKAALTNYGTITIQDSSTAKTGTIKRDDTGVVGETSYYVIRNQGTMTIESGTVINNSGYRKANSTGSMVGSSLICNGDCDEGGTLTIKGGTFTQNNFIAIKNGALGVLHVTGGKITSNHSAIQNWFEADITGGEINGQLWTDAWKEGESVGKTTIGGNAKFTGEIVMDITGKVAPTLAINGGNLNVTNWRITSAAAKAGAKPAVSGGKFTSAVPENYCAEGFIPTKNADNTYGVKAGAYVAQIGDVKYETLQAAIDAVKANETIYVLGNIDLGTDELSTYDVKTTVKNVTIDLGGYTVTSAGRFTVYLQVNGWTIQNGTIQNTNASTTYGTLYVGGRSNSTTLKNLTVESKTNGVQFAIASSKNGIKASITVEDGTKISGNYGVYMKGQPKPWRDTRDGQEILNVNGGEITGTTAAIAVFGAGKGNTKAGVIVNINGGKVYSDSYAIAGNGSSVLENTTINISGGKVFSNKDTAIYHPQAGTVTISGGEVYGVTGGVQMCAGTLNVTGGTISATGNGDVSGKTGDGSIPDGAAVSIVNRAYPAGAPTMTISGGTFTSADGVGAVQAYGWKNNSQQTWDKPNASVSGGTFTSAVPEDYCADGFIPTKNADGTYGVKQGTYVAQIGDVKYETLAAAIAAAKDGDTVTLLKDCSGNGIQIKTANFADKGLIVDFGGFTYTVGGVLVGSEGTGTNAFQLLQGNKITFKNGTIAGVAENTKPAEDTPNWHGAPAIVIQNYCDLTLKNMTVSGGDETVYTMSNNCGNVVIEDTTINAGKAKGYTSPAVAFDVCRYSSYPSVTVTVKGNSVIIGDVEVSGTIGEGQSRQLYVEGGKFTGEFKVSGNVPANITVSGGTFSSAVKEEYCAPGYIPTTNSDGTYGVKEGVYVAKVDNVKYETLQAAINAAKGGSTVRLLANVTLTETAVFPAGKTVHLNLVGHNITATGTALRINGKTDIQSTDGVGTIESTGNVAVAVGDNASLTVYSGTLKGREGAVITGTSTGAKIEIRTKATLIATDNAVIAGNGSQRDGKPNTILVKGGTFIGGIETDGYIACGIYAPWKDNVTVSGGTFKITNGAGIVARAGTVKVTNGTFNCGDGTAKGWVGDSKNKVPCAALVFDKAANYPALTESSQILVSGGTFSTDPAANGATLAAGYAAAKDESGMYKVAKENPAAEINGVKYDTLQAAINAAQATQGGATITLLKNINTESYYTVNGDNPVTIDLAGHNITGSGISGLFYVTAKGDLTIKGEGTVTAVEDNGAAMAVWVRSPIAKVTLEGGTYTQQITDTADPHFDLIYVERGNVYVKGGTYEGFTPDWTLNCKDENYQSKEAKIEVTGGTFKGFDPANNTAEGEGTNFVPAGYVSTKGADGKFIVTEVKVAEVNGKQYGTLSEAITAANAGDTVKLLRDINTPEISYMISKSLTIDLNGKTVTGDGYDAVFQIDNADAKVLIKNGNIVAVEQSGSAGKYTMAIWASEAGCEVTLEGLDVRQRITHTDDPQMDMIYTSGGTIIINSGNFVSGTPAWTLNCKDAAYKAGTANIIVKGGTFTGFDPANNKAEGENTNFVAAGYKSVDNNDGTYTVVKNENVVAVIGTKEYATLEEATDAAAVSGSTVVLMADVTEEKWVGVESNVTLDLNGHSITGVKGFFANGNVIDTSATKGVVSAKGYTMNPTNAYLPIYDSEHAGYSFFNLKVLSGSKSQGANSVLVRFQLDATAERDAAFALMKKGATLSHVQACVSITWVEGTTIQSQTFTFNDAFMAAYCNPENNMVFDVVFSGLDNIKGTDVKAVAKFATSNINGSPMCSRDGKDLPIK